MMKMVHQRRRKIEYHYPPWYLTSSLLSSPRSPRSPRAPMMADTSTDSSQSDSKDPFDSLSFLQSLDLEEDLSKLFERDELDGFKEAFKNFDKDGDGCIQTKELRAALQNLGQNPTDLELQNIFNEMDIDRNGTIDFAEFVKMLIKTIKQDFSQEDLKVAFDVFDTEGYGYIDSEEIKDLLGDVDQTLTVAEQEEIMSKAGKVDSGRMSFAQFSKLLTWS
ncbi:uncharacterized protein [Clytia hemisphaerica]|uniref:EF-hand domain-containing protein n=1 Tax=Clytia hemisphaerica TaxID=252671 RepID=A0A7M5WK42_9CNID